MIETNDSPEPPDPAPPPSESRAARRRLPRFGLRTLLIFGLVFCLLFGLLGRNLVRIRREDAAIETLKQAGATIYVAHGESWEYHPETPDRFDLRPDWSVVPSFASRLIGWSGRAPVMRVEFTTDDTEVERLNAALASLATFPEIEDIGLAGPRIDDSTLDSLSTLPNLKTLALARTSITKAGLAGISSPERIRALSLYRQSPPADVLDGISALTELRYVQLIDRPVTREEMTRIVSLPNLRTLRLIAVTPAQAGAFAPLRDAQGLRELCFDSQTVDDSIVDSIAGLAELESLALKGISDAGLGKLASLPSLRLVELGPSIAPEAAQAFAAAHPDCLVVRSAADYTVRYFRGTEELDREVAETLLEAQAASLDDDSDPWIGFSRYDPVTNLADRRSNSPV